MRAIQILSHLLCFAAGLILVAISSPQLSGDSSVQPDHAGGAAPVLHAKTQEREEKNLTHPRELLEKSARMPMESGHRELLKRKLLAEWSERDPWSLLEWLKGRPWRMTSFWDDGVADALRTLARKDPEGLLRYARQEGSLAALEIFAESGQPAETLRRLIDWGGDALPTWVITDVFSRGCEIDPQFHEHLRELPAGPARSEAAMTIAEAFLTNRRLEDCVEWIRKEGAFIPLQEVGERIASELFDPAMDLAFFDMLPGEARTGVADGFFGGLTSGSFASEVVPERMLTLFSFLLQRGLLEENCASAGKAIENHFTPLTSSPDGSDPFASSLDAGEVMRINQSGAKDLIEWVKGLPHDEDLRSLRTAAWKSAILLDPSTQGQLDGLGDAKLRDICLAWSAYHLEADAARVTLEKITDEEVRAQLQRYLEWKEEVSDPFLCYDGPLPWNE